MLCLLYYQKKGETIMAKPSVSVVRVWEVVVDSDLAQLAVGTAEFPEDYWRLTNKVTGKKKYFYGETAWSDSRREAIDLEIRAWTA
jgi:hypothetical protein